MLEKRIRIADIQTSELLYFDPDFQTESYQFCRERNIDCLPLIGDETAFYMRNDGTADFEPQKITEERKIAAATYILQPGLLSHFRRHHLLFVFEHSELTGVIHFSDYNKNIVQTYLYSLLSAYERDLRMLAKLSGLTNDDMCAHFDEKLAEAKQSGDRIEYFSNKVSYCQRKREEMKRVPEFQMFYLEDLIGMLKTMKLSGKVIDLRNAIMHSHELVNMVNVAAPDYIYNFKSFQQFFKRVQLLCKDAKQVKNRIAFMQGIESLG